MRFYLLYLFIFLSFQNIVFADDRSVKYTIGYESNSNCLPIKVDFIGSDSGKTEIDYPREIWGMDLSSQVNELKLLNPRQYFTQSENTSIIHRPKEEISLSYKVCSLESNELSYVRPYVSNNISHFIGFMGLVIPKFDKEEAYYCLKYDYELPKDMKVYNSLSGMKTVKYQDLEQSLVVFGHFKSVKLFDGNYLYINSKYINLDKLVTDLNKVLKTESQLFQSKKVKPRSIGPI